MTDHVFGPGGVHPQEGAVRTLSCGRAMNRGQSKVFRSGPWRCIRSIRRGKSRRSIRSGIASRTEAEDIVHREPELATFIYSTVLHHNRLEDSVIHRLADRLDHAAMAGDLIRQTYDEALRDQPDLGNIFRADLVAVYDRDPATSRFIDPLLYFKGFPRAARHIVSRTGLYQKGPQGLRLLSAEPVVRRCSRQTSIRPRGLAAASSSTTPPASSAARPLSSTTTSRSCTAVTLGGNRQGERGPSPENPSRRADRGGREDPGQYRDRPLARASPRGSVVVKPVPHNVTVAGVPAKIVGEAGCAEPSRTMDQMISAIGL